MSLAPNKLRVVEQVNEHYPGLIVRDPHAFTNAVAYTLWLQDKSYGHNIKRGSQGLSEDAICKLDESSPLKTRDGRGIFIIDIIGSAGSPNASPAWIDQTQATLSKGETGAWSEPKAPGGSLIDPAPAPAPTPAPPPASPCRFQPCACAITPEDIKGLFEAFMDLRADLARVAARNEELAATLVGHVDDVKGRIERVSQELANKPEGGKCRLRF